MDEYVTLEDNSEYSQFAWSIAGYVRYDIVMHLFTEHTKLALNDKTYDEVFAQDNAYF